MKSDEEDIFGAKFKNFDSLNIRGFMFGPEDFRFIISNNTPHTKIHENNTLRL